MNTDWLGSAGDKLGRTWNQVNSSVYALADARRTAQLRQLVYASAGLWLILNLAQILWMLLPQPPESASISEIVNPLSVGAGSSQSAAVDIDTLVGWNLFGTVSQLVPRPVQVAPTTVTDTLDNIEANASDTRLALKLQGVVSSSDPAVAVAVIEHKNKQQQYRLGDKLPLGSNVRVAKILADRVVLDNGGKYELLKLFDKESLANSQQLAPAETTRPARQVDQRRNPDVAEMAEQYRQRLYRDPQSLADVVKISAVRNGGQLQGYRVSPGRDKDQFEQLGFRAGDVVTGVNGIALTDPGKAMELYRVMRSAQEASFDVQRGEEILNISVSFDPADAQ